VAASGPRCVFKLILSLIYRDGCPTSGLFAHCEGPSCGMIRGMVELLNGNLGAAVAHNRAVPLVFTAMLIVLIINIVKVVRE